MLLPKHAANRNTTSQPSFHDDRSSKSRYTSIPIKSTMPVMVLKTQMQPLMIWNPTRVATVAVIVSNNGVTAIKTMKANGTIHHAEYRKIVYALRSHSSFRRAEFTFAFIA